MIGWVCRVFTVCVCCGCCAGLVGGLAGFGCRLFSGADLRWWVWF